MWRAVTYFILIAIMGMGAAWIADQPGEVTLTWLGREITMDVVVAAGLVVVIVIVIILFISLVKLIMGGPQAFTDFLSVRRERSGYSALSSGMLAVGSGNVKLAAKHAAQANKLLSDEPLTLLLKAQTAQLQGDDEEARRIFDAMLQRSDTELLGLHGLFVEAQRAGDMELARAYAERAVERQPDLPWAGKAVLKLQSASNDWAMVEQTIDRNQRNKLISKPEANKKRAVLKVSQAMDLEKKDEAAALKLAEDAHKLDPNLVPAAVIAGRLLSARGDIRKATRILERTWRKSAHPDIAEVYGDVRAGDSPRDRLKRVRSLASIGFSGDEGAIAVARAAIDAQLWDDARSALETCAQNRPSQRICMLMAEIEQGDKGDTGRVREWLARGVRAPRDPQWTADGYSSASWLPTSPVSGELGAFQWKVPVELIGAEKADDFTLNEPAGPVVDAVIVAAEDTAPVPDEVDIIDVEEVKPEPEVEDKPDGIDVDASDFEKELDAETNKVDGDGDGGSDSKSDDDIIVGKDVAAEKSDSEADTQSDTKAATGSDAKDDKTEEPFVPPRPPDDPGPAKKPEDEDPGFFSSVKDRLSGN